MRFLGVLALAACSAESSATIELTHDACAPLALVSATASPQQLDGIQAAQALWRERGASALGLRAGATLEVRFEAAAGAFYGVTDPDDLGDASEFSGALQIRGVDIDGYKILRTESPAVPNAIAALLLHLRDMTGKIPHVYFGWSEGNPIMYLARYILFGEGDTAPVTREILRQAEPDPEMRPNVHVGG